MKLTYLLMSLCTLTAGGASCGNAQKTHISDSATDTAAAVVATVASDSADAVSEVSPVAKEFQAKYYENYDRKYAGGDQATIMKYEGTIGGEKVSMIQVDTADALDMDSYERIGLLTFKATGKSYRLEGYLRQWNLFLDAYDEAGKKVGVFESREGDELDGTYSNLLDGKTYEAHLKYIQ